VSHGPSAHRKSGGANRPFWCHCLEHLLHWLDTGSTLKIRTGNLEFCKTSHTIFKILFSFVNYERLAWLATSFDMRRRVNTLSVDVGYVHVQSSPLGWLQEFYSLDMDRHCCIISTWRFVDFGCFPLNTKSDHPPINHS
jgi:hypothetical protein